MTGIKLGSLTQKQEIFAQTYVATGKVIEALNTAYPPKKAHVNAKSRSAYATRTFHIPAVQDRIRDLQAELSARVTAVTLRSAEDIIAFAERLALAAAATGKYSASNSSLALIAKILGVAKPEKIDVNLTGQLNSTHYDLSGMDIEQRKLLLQSLSTARKEDK